MSEKLNAKVGGQPEIEITLRQAEELVKFFGGHDCEVTVMQRPAAWHDMPDGLYAYCTQYPEEGATHLGVTEVDDDLAMHGRPAPAEADKELRRAVQAMIAMLGNGEWAEHISRDGDASALEAAITELHGELAEARENVAELEATFGKAPSVPDSVIELIQRYGDQRADNELFRCGETMGELIAAIRGLMTAAQSAAPAATADPLDTPIPCDLTVGRVTIRKGCRFRTVKVRMEVLHSMAMENTFRGLKDKAPAEAKSMLDDLIAQHVPTSAQAETDYLLSSPANAAHIARSMEQARNGQVQERQLAEVGAEDPGESDADGCIGTNYEPFTRQWLAMLSVYIRLMREGAEAGHMLRVERADRDLQAMLKQARALLAAVPPLQISPSSDAGAVTTPEAR